MRDPHTQHVFIIGCKGIPAHYGGFETFVDKLTGYHKNPAIQYHVACAVEPEDYDRSRARFSYHRAKCVTFPWRKLGPARAITYDVDALRYFLHYVEKHQISRPVFYILACRIGPFIGYFARCIRSFGGELFVNPDGHEFLRAKWSPPVRRYWKFSEKLMVKHADRLICDSRTIEQYIKEEYHAYHPKTAYIAYGAETVPSRLLDDDARLLAWYEAHGLRAGEYYLVVGRFVPENNYETMIREFMQSDTDRKFALITNVSDDFLKQLRQRTGFEQDPRICFAGTVYDQQLLKKIRENAYGYFHGHEVGGTNPSLLEALACTKLNLLLDVGFNREVALDSAYYWTKEAGSLAALVNQADQMDQDQIDRIGEKARLRITECYSWESVVHRYEQVFLE
ncbi:MAG: glycosyltransferase family 1 protein [Eubacterium sp.]|nr:glycosyltransferase family 1 protein [Eubacterium sp.]MCI8917176.1 glycosyltransferase family 1 protein [Eubacterium sp.]